MQSLVHLISTLSDVREFNKTNHGLIFANTLHKKAGIIVSDWIVYGVENSPSHASVALIFCH